MKNLQSFDEFLNEGYYSYEKTKITPRDANNGIQYILLRDLMPTSEDKYVKSIEDLSSEKGIKFQIELNDKNGTITAYVINNIDLKNSRAWEWYYNGKKINYSDLQKKIADFYLSQVDQFMQYANGYDFYANYIDNGGQWQKATDNNEYIVNLFKKLSPSDKKDAHKALIKRFGAKDVEQIFKL